MATAFVAGYEAECAVARALGGEHYQRGFHATATAGTFGAAVACARLLGADAATAETAIGIAATQAAGLKSMFGTMCKPLHAGLASAAGLLAARLAERGFTSARGSIETVQGFGETHASSFDAERGLAEPPRGWYLRSHLFKYHAACYETHSSIEGLRQIRKEAQLAADEVDSVIIHADGGQMRMCAIEEPSSGLETKFSLRHTAALVLAGLDTSAIATFDDTRARDPELVALRARVHVVVDRPGGGPTPVEVRTRDGRRLTRTYDVAVPERDLSLQGRRLREKFESLATPVIGEAEAARIVELVIGLDTVDDVGLVLAAAGG
jgi:2-methylcitrate dehydratase PrpD